MIVLFSITGVVIGTALFSGIYYMGYKAGRRVYEEL